MIRRSGIAVGLLIFFLSDLRAQPKPSYLLQTAPARKIEAIYTYEVRYPNLEAKEWELVVARPRDLPSQSVTKAVIEPVGEDLPDLSDLKQPLLHSIIQSETEAQKTTVRVSVRTEVTLNARRLVPFPVGMKPPVVPVPSDEVKKTALAPTPRLNHDHETFQNWLGANKLRRQKKESEIDFALRVYVTMKKTMAYQRPFDHDGKASSTCRSGKGDCGCLSTVFVCALRANDIPARELVGRLVKSDKPFDKSEYGAHARAEFFAGGVGWVPVDPSFGFGDPSPLGLNHFGNDIGDLLVLHLDGDLLVQTKLAGKATLVRLQGVALWTSGGGNFDKSEKKEDWKIRELPLGPKKK